MRKIYYDLQFNRYVDAQGYDPLIPRCFRTIVDCAPLGSTFELWRLADKRFAFEYNEMEIKNGAVDAKRQAFAKSCGFSVEYGVLYELHISKSRFDEICKAYELTPIEI